MSKTGLRTRDVYQMPFVWFEVSLFLGLAAVSKVSDCTVKQGVSLGASLRFRLHGIVTWGRPADKDPVARRPLGWLSRLDRRKGDLWGSFPCCLFCPVPPTGTRNA